MPRTTKYEQENPELTIEILGRVYVVNAETGEILQWPRGEARTMDHILELALFAEQAERAWKGAAGGFRAIIRKLMERSGVERVRGGAGHASIVLGRRRVPGGPGFLQWLKDVEFPPDAYHMLLGAAQEFTPSAFEDVCAMLGMAEDDVQKAMTQTSSYVRLTAARPDPPRITRAPDRDA